MLAGACHKKTVAEPIAAPEPAASACNLDDAPMRRPAAPRVVAVGDIHGDIGAARAALRAAGAIDDKDHWAGGALVIVQTGDLLDRGNDEEAILEWFGRLEGEAKTAGGAFVGLVGNHELMNAARDFRYVTPAGFRDFGDAPGVSHADIAGVGVREQSRVAALDPGKPFAKQIAEHNVVTIVGDTVYSHAGVLPAWTSRLDEVNHDTRCWLSGQAPGIQAPTALTAQDSPVWTRSYGVDPPDCPAVKQALASLGAKRMIVGHTVQHDGITNACDGTLWRIDVGMTKMFDGPIQVLELTDGNDPKVISGTR